MMRPIFAVPLLAAAALSGCDKPGSGASQGTSGQKLIVTGGPSDWAAGLPTLSGPPDIMSENEEPDMADLVLFISERKTDPDGGETLIAEGTHKGVAVGIEVHLSASWKGAKPSQKSVLNMRSGIVILRSMGEKSDMLLKALDEIYGTKLAPARMVPQIELSAISLDGDPGDLDSGPAMIKLFNETEEYAEFFLNVSVQTKRIQLREKDPEYREAIVKGLTAP